MSELLNELLKWVIPVVLGFVGGVIGALALHRDDMVEG